MSDKQPTVLLLANQFQVRGSSLYTLRLAPALAKEGIRAPVLTTRARWVDPDTRNRLEIMEFENLFTPVWGRVVQRLVLKRLKERPPDLIHVQSRSMLPLGTWLARSLQIPYVLTVHDYLPPREKFPFDRTWGKRIIAVSKSVQKDLQQRCHLPDDLFEVIHTGIGNPVELKVLPVLDPTHIPVIGTAGPLEAGKGLPYFLGAAQKVLASGNKVEFLIAGAGPEERNLRRLARDLKITEWVTFIPNLLDFTQALAAMDIFCLTSVKQGLGTIMLEAMGLGKPVIATGAGGVYTVIRDHETGLVIPPEDSGALARKIVELLDDPVRARSIGELGRREVLEKFSVEQMAQRTAEVYRKLLVINTRVPLPVAS